jgi:hypothetical protein
MRTILLASLVVMGCAASSDVPDDSEAETAAPQSVGKADSSQWLGTYASHATHHYNGDVPDLELRDDGHFVRERCYHASCALSVPEADQYDTYKSSTGHTYLRFYGQEISRDANGNITNDKAIADVYEIRTFSHGVQLRKTYSTRWQSLYTTTPTITPCPAGQEFVAGAGGCIANPGANESNCDDSLGMWTDDDATLIGSYCICSIGQYLDATGACTAI